MGNFHISAGQKIDWSVWREIPGTKGRYLINASGVVVRWYARVIYLRSGVVRRIKLKQLRPRPGFRNRQQVTLSVNGEQSNHYVHRLVAAAFLPNPHNLNRVKFLDGDINNISPSNLKWTGKIF